ncbi:hypothetical protein ACFFX1_41460 [Dactylosporangium sucinum]|nr:hypothetical protein [Dactylosporangium sucinum]
MNVFNTTLDADLNVFKMTCWVIVALAGVPGRVPPHTLRHSPG